MSVIIAAHDEERSIGPRIDNLLAVDYPRDCLEIVIASDGSSDRTVAEASRADAPRPVLDLPRTGKASALNAAVAASTGEILVFSDANTAYAPDAIRRLVRSFADPEVGGVAGNQVYLPASEPETDPTGAAAVAAGERTTGTSIGSSRTPRAWAAASSRRPARSTPSDASSSARSRTASPTTS